MALQGHQKNCDKSHYPAVNNDRLYPHVLLRLKKFTESGEP